MAQLVKNLPAVWETWVQSLGWEDHLEKGKATHFLENSMDCIVHGVTKSRTWLSNFHFSMVLGCFFKIFDWRMNVLQCGIGFCHTTLKISHNYICIFPPSWTSLLQCFFFLFLVKNLTYYDNKKRRRRYTLPYTNSATVVVPRRKGLESEVSARAPVLFLPAYLLTKLT